MYTIQLYNIDVVSQAFVKVDEIISFQGLTFSHVLNGVGMATFSMSLYDAKARVNNFAKYRTQVAIKKDDVIVWVGPIVGRTIVYNKDTQMVVFQCLSYFTHLFSRYTAQQVDYPTASISDAGAIALDLINYTQALTNGQLLISGGTIETTTTRTRTYEYAQIAGAIMALSNVISGFDFEFVPVQDSDHDLTGIQFNIYATKGTYRNDLPPLQLDINVEALTQVDTSPLYNTITAIGAGSGVDILTEDVASASAQQSFTRREFILPAKDISVSLQLVDAANNELNESQSDTSALDLQLKPNSVPFLSDLGLGDILRLDLHTDPESMIDIARSARVVQLAVTLDSVGVETITPKIELIP